MATYNYLLPQQTISEIYLGSQDAVSISQNANVTYNGTDAAFNGYNKNTGQTGHTFNIWGSLTATQGSAIKTSDVSIGDEVRVYGTISTNDEYHSVTLRGHQNTVFNSGSIINNGINGAVFVEAGGPNLYATSTIYNEGLIESHSSNQSAATLGMYGDSGQGNTLSLLNVGTIRQSGSGNIAVKIEGGSKVNLTNEGTIQGDIVNMSGGVTVFKNMEGNLIGKYFGGYGVDMVTGGNGSEYFDGGRGDDTLRGGAGMDTISGGEGADKIIGGFGIDTLTGGAGVDRFYFDVMSYADKITDFSVAEDKIVLDDKYFKVGSYGALKAEAFHIGTTATTLAHRIVYNKTMGELYYDADGSGGGGAVMITTINKINLSAGDFQIV